MTQQRRVFRSADLLSGPAVLGVELHGERGASLRPLLLQDSRDADALARRPDHLREGSCPCGQNKVIRCFPLRIVGCLPTTIGEYVACLTQECINYPGFSTVFRRASSVPASTNPLDFENYRHVAHKWHFNVTKVRASHRELSTWCITASRQKMNQEFNVVVYSQAMVACLESTNYVQIRNALIILIKVSLV